MVENFWVLGLEILGVGLKEQLRDWLENIDGVFEGFRGVKTVKEFANL